MTDKKLFEDVAKLGVALFAPEENVDVNQTLAEVVKSHDVRLWENFPALLVTASRKFPLNFNETLNGLKNASDQQVFFELVALTKALTEQYHVSFPQLDKAYNDVEKVYSALGSYLKMFRGLLVNEQPLSVGNVRFSQERLKGSFEDFLSRQNQDNQKMRAKHQELSLEFALSQVFSSRQKELFYKKLNAEKLTKTEREYYSRTVRKKVQALANPDLHRLAQKLME